MAGIKGKVQETWRDLLLLRLQWKPPASAGVKRSNNNDNNDIGLLLRYLTPA